MQHRMTLVGLVCAGALAFTLGGCVSETELVPAAGATPVGFNGALTKVAGIQVRANGEIWPGLKDVRDQVTPVHLNVYNSGKTPIRIRYDQLWLVDQDGNRYAALPPFRIKGNVVAGEYGVMEPGFAAVGFDVAPAYAGVYPDLSVTDYDFDEPTEEEYYAAYYPYWATVEASLPTPVMLRMALPEGVVKPGGRVNGYVYFQHVPANAGRVDLDMRLVNASNKKYIATARIPFAAK